MPKTYKNVGGVWKPIKKIFVKISGTWTEAKKVFKHNTGAWRLVHTYAAEVTFGGNVQSGAYTGIPLQNYVNPASADIFNITINPGVVLYGYTGGTGGTGADGSSGTVRCNCVSCAPCNGGDGGGGGAGSYGLDVSAFGGKTINLYNYGTIKGGEGGAGGAGGSLDGSKYPCGYFMACGCGGPGGPGGPAIYNPYGAIINIIGNQPYSGGTGPRGGVLNRHSWDWNPAYGTYTYDSGSCNCNCNCSAGG